MNQPIKLLVALISLIFSVPALAQESGIASVYPGSFDGSQTASGEIYHKEKLVAAHKIHPMGTQLRVTRTDERARRSVVVTVKDRGPYISGRIVELSQAAGKKIGLGENDVANVLVEVISKPTSGNIAAKSAAPVSPTPNVNKEPEQKKVDKPVAVNTPTPVKASPAPVSKPNPTVTPKSGSAASANPTPQKSEKFSLVRGQKAKYGLFKISLLQSNNKGFGVQVMSLNSPDMVLDQIADLQGKWFDNILVSIQPSPVNGLAPVYKLILGPFPTKTAADSYAENLKKKYKMDGFVVDLATLPK